MLQRRRRAASTGRRLAILLFLSFNSILLFYYVLPSHHHPKQTPISTSSSDNHTHHLRLKPWPQLPSFLPWSPNPSSRSPLSCESLFGNGFSRPADSIRDTPGWFRCLRNDALLSSVCEGGSIRMDPRRIAMSRGGERLKDVMGRREDEELPRFEPGAFQIAAAERGKKGGRLVDEGFLDEYVSRGAVGKHAMRDLVAAIQVVSPDELQCDQWIEAPTLLVIRFEYANVFHTMTDWYSAYVSSRVADLPYRPKVVFVDGHCKDQLEQTWEEMFSGVTYAKNFTGAVCFRHAILSPLGYETAMFKGLSESFSCQGTSASELRDRPDDSKTARLTEFGEMMRAAFHLPVDDKAIKKPISGRNVVFVRREDYVAHPRHDGRVESRLSNEQELFRSLKSWVSSYTGCSINLINGLFAHMPLRDQVRAIQEASLVIGAHGAGLSHLVSARRDTVVLEIVSSFYRRPHFELISEWKGLRYHAIHLAGSYAEPQVVVDKVRSIMQSLGC